MNYPWSKLNSKEIISPFIPNEKENFDKNFCIAEDLIGNQTKERFSKYIQDESFNRRFLNFTFCKQISITNKANSKSYKSSEKQKTNNLFNKLESNSSKIKEFTNILNVNYSKALNERNFSIKAIRDNRLLHQLNDFHIKEDKTDINLSRVKKLPKLLGTKEIKFVRKKIKLLSQASTNANDFYSQKLLNNQGSNISQNVKYDKPQDTNKSKIGRNIIKEEIYNSLNDKTKSFKSLTKKNERIILIKDKKLEKGIVATPKKT